MQICFNGSFHPSSQPVIRYSSRSFRYGDGLFETILFRQGEMPLFNYHMKRLYSGLGLLGYQFPATESDLLQQVKILCQKNNCQELARVRISISGGNGFITEDRNKPDYVIEARELPSGHEFATIENLGFYPDAFKSRDYLANLKSSSALVYVQAAVYGRAHGMDDVLVQNSEKRVADSTIANLFIVKEGELITPSLPEGCVDGVMRRFVLENFATEMNIREGEITVADLESTREIFLTNALKGIIQVKRFLGRPLVQEQTKILRERSLRTIQAVIG